MVKLFVKFMQLPAPTRITTIMYLSCLLGYNIIGTYADSTTYLNKYRLEQQSLNKKECVGSEWSAVKSDWEAVKYGANHHLWERLFASIVWPITTIKNIVPSIVLMLNPPQHKKD